MCEFCHEHGEGKKWYLQMKNYSEELLHQDLTEAQSKAVGTQNRFEWVERFWENYTLPAIVGHKMSDWSAGAGNTDQPLSEKEILAQWKTEHFGQVLPIEDVEKIIDMVDSITRMPCGCRFLTTGLTDKRYCFGFGLDKSGILGKFPDAASSLEVVDKSEAKKMFRHFDREGLIHSVWTGVTPYVIGLCNCDQDCGAYRGYVESQGKPNFFRAEYVCQVDWDQCTGCKSCMSQCQFGAQFYSSALGKVYIDPKRCFGCGVCRTECPNDAIALIPREAKPESANVWLEGVKR